MAELKIFNDGEPIYASDVNHNFREINADVSANAEQVQDYAEAQIAKIETSVATVQSTLQTNIDAISNDLKAAKETIFSAIAPDYNAGVKISSNSSYTVPTYGWIYWTGDGGTGPYYLKINGTNRLSAGALADHDYINVVIPFWVEPNDVITMPSGSNNKLGTIFYPCKGFANEEEQ